jgi:diaminopimelate epimerase
MQGAGNDFILVEAGNLSRNWSQTAIAMCDRHFGVGGDGLLLVLASNVADFGMRMFNPDGSEAEACGNGLRCLARYVADKGLLLRKFEGGEVDKESPDVELANTEAQEILVETMSGIRMVKLYKVMGKVTKIQVSMGEPKFGAKDIPVVIEHFFLPIKPILDYPVTIKDRELSLSFVSMGNPHAVYFWSHQVSDFPLSQLGPEVEQLAIFPNRVNFEVARVIDRDQVEARVWERGVGETLACGSGACAVAVTAQLHGYIDSKVDIKLPGGILEVEWNRGGEVFLSGPAEVVFTGEWAD